MWVRSTRPCEPSPEPERYASEPRLAEDFLGGGAIVAEGGAARAESPLRERKRLASRACGTGRRQGRPSKMIHVICESKMPLLPLG